MPFGNYTELQAAVASWMHRNNLTGSIPDFISLAETRARALLDTRLQKSVVQIQTVAGVEYATLPSDLLQVKSLSIPGINPRLNYMAPDVFNQNFGMELAGTPRCYSIIGDLLYLGPTPDAVYTLMAALTSEVPPLSASNPTNTLLAKWPTVYLYGALSEASKFTRDVALRDSFNADFLTAINDVNVLDWDTPGPLEVRTDILV